MPSCALLLEMRRSTRRVFQVGLIGAFLAASLPGFAADTPDHAVKPIIEVGDSWTFRQSYPGTNRPPFTFTERVTFVGPDLILCLNVQEKSDKEYDTSWTSEWNGKSLRNGAVIQPHTGLLKFPLLENSKYDGGYEVVGVKGKDVQFSIQYSAKVIGWVEIAVPAGKFRAMKVEAEGFIRQVGAPGPGGSVKFGIWYVPEIRRNVRFDYADPAQNWTLELLSYRLRD